MEKTYLTLEQNLCCAKIFLNLFNLNLEQQDEINVFSKIKIINDQNLEVGILYYKNGIVKIQCKTNLGKLNANYNFGAFSGFNDLEMGGAYVDWCHKINFNVGGENSFSGNMQIGAKLDTDFGSNVNVHATINYIDKDNKKVVLNFMDNGYPFKYDANKENFSEQLEINPWNDFNSFMYHRRRNDVWNKEFNCFKDYFTRYVKINRGGEQDTIKTVSYIIKDNKMIECEEKVYDSVGKNESVESTIQKGLLMQKINPDFSKKILEISNFFTNDNMSFFMNLVDVTFKSVNDEERKALFGFEIPKIKYHNGADNLFDAYFGINENNKFISRRVYQKVLK